MELDRESIDAYVDLTVKGSAPDLRVPPQACLVDRPLNPCSIVIFGATGDLTKRKLAPSLYNLFLSEALPESFVIVGAARSDIEAPAPAGLTPERGWHDNPAACETVAD